MQTIWPFTSVMKAGFRYPWTRSASAGVIVGRTRMLGSGMGRGADMAGVQLEEGLLGEGES